MIPSVTQTHLLKLAEIVALLVAHRLTPEAVRKILLNTTKELEELLSEDSIKDVEAAKAKAILRAMAYRRPD